MLISFLNTFRLNFLRFFLLLLRLLLFLLFNFDRQRQVLVIIHVPNILVKVIVDLGRLWL